MKSLLFVLMLIAPCAALGSERNAIKFSNAQLRTGINVRYAEQGNPSGPRVIMLHGYGDSWFSFNRILPLMDRKFHIYILDQRGHGDSDRPASGYTFSDFAGDVLAFMDAKGLKKVSIVGHSMGSFVAQHVAARAPERVSRLVLIGSATSVNNNIVTDLQRAINELSDPVSRKFVTEFQHSIVVQPVPQEFMTRIIDESMKIPARVWRDVMAGMLAPGGQVELKKITAPTLVIWGDRETVFPDRADQDALASAIPNAVLRVYADTGHGPTWERPEWVAKDLHAFLK